MKKKILSIFTLCAFLVVFSSQNVIADSVDVNTADASTISKNLKGIGLKKATRIVEFRIINGPFRTIDDLAKVKGIGVKTIERNKEDIIVSK